MTNAPAQRLADLRAVMASQSLDAVLVPRGDEHLGEYVPPSAERLSWLTGFTGSAGLAVVLKDRAALFVDGRYTLQAANQASPDLYEIHHLIGQPYGAWLKSSLPKGARVGYDSWLHSAAGIEGLKAELAAAGVEAVPVQANPIDAVWADRPAAPLAPVVPHPPVAKLPEPKPAPTPTPTPPKVRPVEKPKIDQLAKLMAETPTDATPAPTPHPAPRAKPAKPTSDAGHFDPTDISKLLTGAAPAQRASTAHDSSRVASLGSPTASAAKMAPSMWAGLDGLMEDQYRTCWSYLGLSAGQKYIPQVRVMYGANGELLSAPVLINPPSDPALQSLADSALRAVRRCNPLKIPEQYAPFYEQWKGRVLRFDPEEMAG